VFGVAVARLHRMFSVSPTEVLSPIVMPAPLMKGSNRI
jgi:hypothetical protein